MQLLVVNLRLSYFIMILVIAVPILVFHHHFTPYTQFKIQLAFLLCNLRSHGDLQLCRICCFNRLSTNRRSSIGENGWCDFFGVLAKLVWLPRFSVVTTRAPVMDPSNYWVLHIFLPQFPWKSHGFPFPPGEDPVDAHLWPRRFSSAQLFGVHLVQAQPLLSIRDRSADIQKFHGSKLTHIEPDWKLDEMRGWWLSRNSMDQIHWWSIRNWMNWMNLNSCCHGTLLILVTISDQNVWSPGSGAWDFHRYPMVVACSCC